MIKLNEIRKKNQKQGKNLAFFAEEKLRERVAKLLEKEKITASEWLKSLVEADLRRKGL